MRQSLLRVYQCHLLVFLQGESVSNSKLRKLKRGFEEKLDFPETLEPAVSGKAGDLFEKYIEKMKDVTIDGKYVTMSTL